MTPPPRTVSSTLLSAATAVYGRFMAIPPPREEYLLHRLTVTANVEVAPRVRRITLAAESLRTFVPVGPDEYFALILPRPGVALALPAPEVLQVARAVRDFPVDIRPDVRCYTVRRHRPERGEIDVDVVTHGDAGPGSAWALRARPGDEVGLKEGSAGYRRPAEGLQLLAADETALPALAHIAEELAGTPDAARVRAFVEVDSMDSVADRPESIDITWVVRGSARPGDLLADAIAEALSAGAEPGTGTGTGSGVGAGDEGGTADAPGFTSAWLCGEGGGVARLRRLLLTRTALTRRSVFSKGYWQAGRPTE